MIVKTTRRKRRRRPTMTPRFGSSTIALEIGLVRMTLDMQRDIEKKESRKENEDKSQKVEDKKLETVKFSSAFYNAAYFFLELISAVLIILESSKAGASWA